MRYPFLLVAIVCVLTLLEGCGLRYKMEINQGNYVTQDMVARLKPGQTRQQVRLALGSPVTESIFHNNRWDYDYSLVRGERLITSHRLAVFFENDKLVRWEDTNLPASPVVVPDPAQTRIQKDNQREDTRSWWSDWLGW